MIPSTAYSVRLDFFAARNPPGPLTASVCGREAELAVATAVEVLRRLPSSLPLLRVWHALPVERRTAKVSSRPVLAASHSGRQKGLRACIWRLRICFFRGA